jgi:hypothetical protein
MADSLALSPILRALPLFALATFCDLPKNVKVLIAFRIFMAFREDWKESSDSHIIVRAGLSPAFLD